MKKNIFLTSLTSIFFLGVCIGQNPFTIVNEEASNYGIVVMNGLSGGSGFGSNNWSVTDSGFNTQAATVSSPLSNKSFTLEAGGEVGGGSITASRIFNSVLSNGDLFSIRFASDNPETGGSFSISLTDTSGTALITLSYTSGDSGFTLNDGGVDIDSNVSFSADTEFIFSVTYLGSNDYSYSINGTDSSTISATNPLNINGLKITATDFKRTNGNVNLFGFDNINVDSSVLNTSNTIYDTDVSLIDLTINSGATLTINSTGSLNVSDDFINNGSIVLNSASNDFSSLIASSASGSGTYTYNRYVASSSTFDIVSAPFTDQTFSNLLSNNSGMIYFNSNDVTQYAYGPFNNDLGAYVQYDSDTDGGETMDAGLGFRTGTDNGATLAFTGTFQTSNVTEPISLGQHNTYGRWNLIGNPFPSYLDLYHFFTDNSGILDTSYAAIYTYDGDDSNGSVWTTYNGNNSSGQYIAPGQAFFVAASGSANISFDTDMQSVAGGDDFLPGEKRPNDDSFAQNASSSNSKISLALSFDDSKYAATDIYLNTKASSGLDVGYDAGTFANQAGSLGLYSFLADGSHPETKLAIQAVSNNITDPVVIPLGVNAQSGIDYTIKLKERPQQEGVFVYLKDKLDNSMTLLTDEDYSFNTSADLQGDGRFEVHLSAFALSTFDISKAPYSMIGLSGKVQVTGELSKGDVITILDLRGRTLAKQTVNSPTQSTTVQLNGVSKGVYIGKVENNIGQYNTKFILK